MTLDNVRKQAIATVKQLVNRGNSADAEHVIGLFKADDNSPLDDLAFYGRILFLGRRWLEARRILTMAKEKSQDDRFAKDLEAIHWMTQTREDLRDMQSGPALSYVLSQSAIRSVLDVGSGGGEHALQFALAGRQVHCIDFGVSKYVQRSDVLSQLDDMPNVRRTTGDFMQLDTDERYDLVWCSHCLEHQPNPNAFLRRCMEMTAEDGWLAMTVPPLKHQIVGGHVTLWNAGLVLYQMVMAGNDCSDALVMNYGYNISVIVRRRPVTLPSLDYDAGDIDRLSAFFPPDCGEGFDGRMTGYSVDRKPAPAANTDPT